MSEPSATQAAVKAAMKEAMKSRDKERLATIRLMQAENELPVGKDVGSGGEGIANAVL